LLGKDFKTNEIKAIAMQRLGNGVLPRNEKENWGNQFN
jgi:hypothetical protein